MFCEKCGTKNEETSVYCKNCGALLVKNDGIINNISGDIIPEQNMVQNTDVYMHNISVKMSKWSVIIAVEIIMLAILAYGLKWVGDKFYGPEYVAERYFETIMEGDLKDAYNFLDVKESDFISKELFCETYTSDGRGEMSDFSVKMKKFDAVSATVEVTYRISNEKEERAQEILLLKKDTKKFFIFNDWKVQPQGLIYNDLFVSVPHDAAVTMDGIIIEKELKQDGDGLYDVYLIPEVFFGNHIFKVEMDGAQPVVKNMPISNAIDFGEDNVIQISHLHLQKESLNKITKNSKSVFKSIMDAKVKDSDAGFIDDLVDVTEGADYTKNYYEDFLSSDSDYIRVEDIEIKSKNFDEDDYGYSDFSSESYQTVAVSEVTCKCNYKNEYSYDESQDEIMAVFYYGYINGKLGLQAVKMTSYGW